MTRKRNPTSDMKRYKIIWEIDMFSDNPIEAAAQALIVQRDKESCATVFGVMEAETGIKYTIDLDGEEGLVKKVGYELGFKRDPK